MSNDPDKSVFEKLEAEGIILDDIGKDCIKKQLEEIVGNINEEDLANEDFMRGAARILCGGLGYYIDSEVPELLKGMMLYTWMKYTFLAVIKIKLDRGYNLDYTVDRFKESDIAKHFDTKVTLAQAELSDPQEGTQDGERTRPQSDGS